MKGYCQVYAQKNVHIREIKQAVCLITFDLAVT